MQVETVVWNETLARNAAVWASYLADNNLFEHATNIPNEGENLYMSTAVPNEPCTAATQAFYNEIKDYDFNKPGFSLETGHFTQVSQDCSTIIFGKRRKYSLILIVFDKAQNL